MAVTATLMVLAAFFLLLVPVRLESCGPLGGVASGSTGREVVLNGDLDVRLFSWTPLATARS